MENDILENGYLEDNSIDELSGEEDVTSQLHEGIGRCYEFKEVLEINKQFSALKKVSEEVGQTLVSPNVKEVVGKMKDGMQGQ